MFVSYSMGLCGNIRGFHTGILHRDLKGRLPSGSKQLNAGDVHDIGPT